MSPNSQSRNILFALTGSIACFKACALISQLVKSGFVVQCAATTSALRFIGEATLEGLTGRPVFKDAYEPGRMMDHIHLNKWADLTLICPATANTINKTAAGIGDDALSSLLLAHDFQKPLWFVPAMNQNMYSHPATQESLLKLKAWGAQIIDTDHGRQACGDVGLGRMKEPEEVLKLINNWRQKIGPLEPVSPEVML
jgi:phosphopantothenoylcysteine synthetase/decarboxylase